MRDDGWIEGFTTRHAARGDAWIARIEAILPRLLPWAAAAAATLLFAGSILMLVRTRVVFDSLWPQDTIYILNTAWTIWSGFRPNIDFTDRYGGLVARLIAFCFRFGGPSVKAIDHAYALAYVGLTAALLAACARRLGWPALFAAFVVLTALVTAKTPLEYPYSYMTYVAHATFYNRVGWSLLMLACLVAAVPARGSEVPGLVLAGLAYTAMTMTKLSFGLAAVPMVAAFLVTGRPRAMLLWIGSAVGAFLLFWLLFGMGPAQWGRIGSAMAALSGDANRLQPVVKGLAVVLRGLFPLLALTMLGIVYLQARRTAAAPYVIVAALLALVGIAIAITTGTFYMKAVDTPIFAIAAIVLAEWMARARIAALAIFVPATFAIGSFAVPYLINAVAAHAQERRIADFRLTDHGPLANYAVGAALQHPLKGGMTAANIASVADRIRSDGSPGVMNAQQSMILQMEAVPAIEALPGYRGIGILSPGARFYPFVLGSRPITSFDHWPSWTDPARAARVPLPADVGLLVLVRDDLGVELYRSFARAHFVPCRRTVFSDIYLSKALLGTVTARGCDPALTRQPGA